MAQAPKKDDLKAKFEAAAGAAKQTMPTAVSQRANKADHTARTGRRPMEGGILIVIERDTRSPYAQEFASQSPNEGVAKSPANFPQVLRPFLPIPFTVTGCESSSRRAHRKKGGLFSLCRPEHQRFLVGRLGRIHRDASIRSSHVPERLPVQPFCPAGSGEPLERRFVRHPVVNSTLTRRV